MSLETYKKVEIEKELKKLIDSGISKEEAAACLVDRNEAECINYIIEASLMPIEEITREIESYDSSSPKLDELKFVYELCKKYNVDRKAVIERIQNVRRINKHAKQNTPNRLSILKQKRDALEREKKRIFDSETMDSEEKSMYYFGLGVVTVVSGVLFYPASPVLVGIIPIAYATGLPAIRTTLIMKREKAVVNKLVNLGKEIEYLERNLKEKEEEKVTIVDNNQDYVNLRISNTLEIEKEQIITGPKLVKRKK